ncbi:dipeptidase PepE [Polaribacter pectinis]|uniref:Dipeptidase PepE n=1 Tax=Polaribacter pectinis TaxID=2738844 RepID=A0A7G9LD41_9FLAO|nr:dipeptidase PepE [Polaribacter pectinis]QNM86540.1 dipeptidase PepE [Polaribacter pectinis]
MKKMIIASTSTVYGSSYLEYLLPTLKTFFKGVHTLVFIPFARPGGVSYDGYTEVVQKAFSKIDINVKGVHEYNNVNDAILNAEAIFTGGGNTFELVNQLYKNDIIDTLKKVINNGTPYLGTSAGSNICGISMMNTNDMPIVYPPSFVTLGCIPFNINAHYLDPIEGSKHMGETRETRIKEYHVFNEVPVLGLREGSWLSVEGNSITLKGEHSARLFQQNLKPVELESGVEVALR